MIINGNKSMVTSQWYIFFIKNYKENICNNNNKVIYSFGFVHKDIGSI